MKIFILFVFLLLNFDSLNAQPESIQRNQYNTQEHFTRIPEPETLSRFKRWSIYSGYHLNFKDSLPNPNTFHFLELGVMRSVYTIPRLASLNFYSSSELKLNGDSFIIGPKLGSYIQYLIFTLGIETIYYTDFDDHSIRLSIQPFGIGTESFKFSINPQIVLYDTGIAGVGNGSFSFTIHLFNLFKKETILK